MDSPVHHAEDVTMAEASAAVQEQSRDVESGGKADPASTVGSDAHPADTDSIPTKLEADPLPPVTLPGPPPRREQDATHDSSAAAAAAAATAAAATRTRRSNRWSDAVEGSTAVTANSSSSFTPSANLSLSDDLSKMSVPEIQRQLELIKQENLLLKSGLASIAAGTSVYTPAAAEATGEPQLPPEIRALKDRERDRKEKQKRLQEALRHNEGAAAVTVETMFDADHALRYVPAKRQIAPASAPASTAAGVAADSASAMEDADYDPFADHESAVAVAASTEVEEAADIEQDVYIKVDHQHTHHDSPPPSPKAVKQESHTAQTHSNGAAGAAAPPAVAVAAAPAAAVAASASGAPAVPEAKKGFVLIRKNNFLPVKRSVYQPPPKPAAKVEPVVEAVVAPVAVVKPLVAVVKAPGEIKRFSVSDWWLCAQYRNNVTFVGCRVYSTPWSGK